MLASLNEQFRVRLDDMKGRFGKVQERVNTTLGNARRHAARVPTELRQILEKTRSRLFVALDIPQKEDIESLAKRIEHVETRMANLGTKAPSRTKETA